jgi:hypothetical protein
MSGRGGKHGPAGVFTVVQSGVRSALKQGQISGTDQIGGRGANRGGDVDSLTIVERNGVRESPRQLGKAQFAAGRADP